MDDRLYRSRSDRMLAGVAGGLAEHYVLDPSLVRIGWALLIVLTGGIFLLLYIVMAIVVPEEPMDAAPSTWTEAPMTDPTPAAGAPAVGTDANPSPAAVGGAPDQPAGSAPASPAATTSAPAATGWGAPATGAAPAMSAREARRAARRERRNDAPLIFGAILVIVGILAFAGQVFPAFDWDLVWPILLVVLGIALVIGATRRRPS